MTDDAHEQVVRSRTRAVARAAVLPVALSIAAGVGTALLDLSIGLGVIAALLVGVIVLQIQVLTTIDKTDVDAQLTVRELAPFLGARELDRATGDYLLKLAQAQIHFLQTDADRPTAFDLELGHQRERLLDQYEECARGILRVNLRASPILRETDGVSTVTKSFRATSLVPPHAYWDGASGQSYLQQHQGMLDGGVEIKRVFIQSPEALDELIPVVSKHLDWRSQYGATQLDVRVVFLEESLDGDLIEDFGIVDDATVIRLETHRGLAQPTAVVWESSAQATTRANRHFDRLWSLGHDPVHLPGFTIEHAPVKLG
jgi:hypothetical protein